MTRFLDIRIGVSDDEFTKFLDKLASSAVSIGASDEDGEELSLEATGDTDKTGVPWLESVHAGTKNQTKDKRWKRKQGVSEAERDAAENAWRAANPAGLTPATTAVTMPQIAAPAAVSTPVPGVAIPGMAPAVAPVAAVSIPGMTAPAPAPVIPPVEPDIPATIEDVSAAFGRLQTVTTITDDFVDQIYKAAGLTTPDEMITSETARRSVIKTINATIDSVPKA